MRELRPTRFETDRLLSSRIGGYRLDGRNHVGHGRPRIGAGWQPEPMQMTAAIDHCIGAELTGVLGRYPQASALSNQAGIHLEGSR